jgi:DNA-directed RNA polymerase subunit M/transcription elongation factor TFIIS
MENENIKELKAELVRHKEPESSAVCLVCGGDELDWQWPMTGEGDEVWHRVTCQDCDANWQDVYTFSGIDNLKKEKK